MVRFSELTPTRLFALDGENSEFTCNLFGGSSNISINSEWLITLRNGTTIRISGNSSNDFIVLPPHNSMLVIVRHSEVMFNLATITCTGGRNFTGINATLTINRKCSMIMDFKTVTIYTSYAPVYKSCFCQVVIIKYTVYGRKAI